MPAAGQAQVRHYRFALMYLFGPDGIRGNWEAAGQQAGFKEVPSRRGKTLLGVIEEVQQYRPPPARVDLSNLNIPGSDAPVDDWKRLAEQVKPIWMNAALGVVQIDAQQRLIMKEIIDRAEGKVGQAQKDEGPKIVQPVILLPTIGGEKAAVLCEQCQQRVKEAI